jgi:hypothetical protein
MTYSLFGGIITGATIGLPVLSFLNCFCCAGVILGGFLAVFLAMKDVDPASPGITKSDALQLGIFSGLFGAAIGTVFHVMILFLAGDFFLDMVSSFLSEAELDDVLPPEVMDQLWGMLNNRESISVFDVFFHLFLWLFLGPLFGLLGGLLGYSLLQKPRLPMNPILPPNP